MNEIVASITTNKDMVVSSGVLSIYVKTKEEKQEASLLLAKVTMGMIHKITDELDVIIIH